MRYAIMTVDDREMPPTQCTKTRPSLLIALSEIEKKIIVIITIIIIIIIKILLLARALLR